jgi:hypothetical protein
MAKTTETLLARAEEFLELCEKVWVKPGPNSHDTEGLVRDLLAALSTALTDAATAQQESAEIEHVCGLQGFGAIGDTCPGCEARSGRGMDRRGIVVSGASPKDDARAVRPNSAASFDNNDEDIIEIDEDGTVRQTGPAARRFRELQERLTTAQQERDEAKRRAEWERQRAEDADQRADAAEQERDKLRAAMAEHKAVERAALERARAAEARCRKLAECASVFLIAAEEYRLHSETHRDEDYPVVRTMLEARNVLRDALADPSSQTPKETP